MHTKRLYRSNTQKIFAGILGGLSEYFNVDPVILRFAYVFMTVFSGGFPGIIVYILGIIIIPKHP